MAKSAKKLMGSTSRRVLGEERTKALKTLLGYQVLIVAKEPVKTKPTEPDYGENAVINHPKLENSSIRFKGKNNILYCEEGVVLRNSNVVFNRDNSIVYLSAGSNGRYSSLYIATSYDSVIFIGKNTNFHESKDFKTHILAQEQKHIIIGDDCVFSLSCWLRTSDAHAVYDGDSKKRLNLGKSIMLGDHVWISQNVTILKGSQIGSGAIVGASSVVAGKRLESNTSYAGSPAKLIRSNVFFDRRDVNHANREIEEYPDDNASNLQYSNNSSAHISMQDIDNSLSAAVTTDDKLNYIKDNLVNNGDKNRFYISSKS